MNRGVILLLVSVAHALCTAAPAQVRELSLTNAALWRAGQPAELKVIKDALGPGRDGVAVGPTRPIYSRLEWTVPEIPEGEYFLELPVLARGYFSFSEGLPRSVLFHNDRLLRWTGHTEPEQPEHESDARRYQACLRLATPVRVKSGDRFALVVQSDFIVGPLRLAVQRPSGTEVPIYVSPTPFPDTALWVNADWEPTQEAGTTISQPCWVHNPGATPLTLHLQARATDYLQSVLLETNETMVLPPHETVSRSFAFPRGPSGITRLLVTLNAVGRNETVSLPKFYVQDLVQVPRPRLSLNGTWELCLLPAQEPEPGTKPPANAAWTNTIVPALLENDQAHCAWYRRHVRLPGAFRGERYVLKFEQALSEAWIYVNGQLVHHQFDGADPFEVDLTPAFRAEGDNELLIAVRDWLAYSPKNQDRVRQGEPPVFKDGMIAPAGYIAAKKFGLGRPLWLEVRPAVAVGEVRIGTSVRQRELHLRYRVDNLSARPQTAILQTRVLDAGKPVLTLPRQTVELAPGTNCEVHLSAQWPNPRLWQPGDPYLYTLETSLQPTTGDPDRHRERFGFREMWIDGIHFVVNGTRMKIRSNWAGGASGIHQVWDATEPGDRLARGTAWQLHALRNWTAQLSRTHNSVGVKEVCEIADETGLMLKIEDGSVCQQAFSFNTNFWNHVIASELRMVAAYHNHPSVFMWSAGNENMWGWMYQGEAVRTIANRWQIRVLQEIRAADLMARPSEWEADGDLLGAWEYHQLHYPRELGGNPDVPVSAWWGPLDGKTVIPYSMGPITLGQKPITDGEAFWPATLSHPFGQSILLGDAAYFGANQQWQGWEQSSQFFINGFRDVEFALIDVYTSLKMIPPQTVVLKEETASFFGGRTLTRQVNVHNDVPHPARLLLTWSLTTPDGLVLDAGKQRLRLAPAELKRLTLQVRLPRVAAPTPAQWRVALAEQRSGARPLREEIRRWMIHPAPRLSAPPGLKLAVFDPGGQTAALLQALQVPFTRLTTLQPPAQGALLIGREALTEPPPGPWREALTAFVRGGGKIVVLEQREAPDFLPVPVVRAQKSKSTLAFVRAADHPVLQGFTDEDLRWWADDHYVSTGNYRKPAAGNVLPLVDTGTLEGLTETPLLEQYLGQGSYLLCQMPLVEKAGQAPAACRILQNLLNYLAQPGAHRQPAVTALLAGDNHALRQALDQSQLLYQDLQGRSAELDPASYPLAIVDAHLVTDAATVQHLQTYARKGGRVLLHNATPEQQSALEALLGLKLRFLAVSNQPNEVQNRVLHRGAMGLLSGVSNHELFWPTKAYLSTLRGEGRWWSDCGPVPETDRIADYFVLPAPTDAHKAVALTRPCALLQIPAGPGAFTLNQLRFDRPPADAAATVGRLRNLLLTNLGGTLRSAQAPGDARGARLRRYEFHKINLAPYANRGLKDDTAAGIVGWTNQGENDMRGLPTGDQAFAGVPFFIAAPRGVVALKSRSGVGNETLPASVSISVGRRADALFFLHAAAYCGGGQRLWEYQVRYADGSSSTIPVYNERQVVDWWSDPDRYRETLALHGTTVAWQGDNPMRKGVILLCYEWSNPTPEKEITEVTFQLPADSDAHAVPLLVGITAAILRSNEGLVTDVVGTRGLRVRLGTQEEEIYYIGVGSLPETHGYYQTALAAHKAATVGQKVMVVDDVVTHDTAGRRVAYVFLAGQGQDVNNLLNAKVIGDGLAPLGEFEGNNRHRMYLENLAFIARQSKRGIWAAEK